jgi:hypothetical protein
MEEQKIVKVTEKQAISKILQRLRSRKIVCEKYNYAFGDIRNENFLMEVSSAHYFSGWSDEENDYDKVNIKIRTNEYPHIRRAFKDFDILKGNYNDLAEKVKFIIEEDIKKKKELKVKMENQNYNLRLLEEKLKGLGAKKEHYGDSYEIKNKFFTMTFYAFDDKISVDIEETADMTLDQAIELIKKVQ